MASFDILTKVNYNFRSVVRGSIAINYVLKHFNSAKTGNSQSKAYEAYKEMVLSKKTASDKIEIDNRLDYLQKCVDYLMKRSNITRDEILNDDEESVKENENNDEMNLQNDDSESELKRKSV